MKRALLSAMIIGGVACGLWATHQSIGPLAGGSLAQVVPQGALLFVEAQDFSGLLREWNSSHEKAAWLVSDNHEVFSRSRLFQRLSQAQSEFATAAGVPPDTAFLNQVAGRNSALALYNIGNLELLYITRAPASDFTRSSLWQKRSQFEAREVAGRRFFVHADPQSGRVVAFALQDDVLVLGTREDLVAGAVALLAGQKLATLQGEEWFARALQTAPREASELRMLVHLSEVAKTPQFRTYWIPRNVTEMQQYESSVSNLERSQMEWREQRTLLLKKTPDQLDDRGPKAVADLVRLAPPDVGFFRAQASPSAKETSAQILELLTPSPASAPASTQAPSIVIGEGVIGSESDLETDISAAAVRVETPSSAGAAVEKLVSANGTQAVMQIYGSTSMADGVFVKHNTAMVLSAEQPWNENAVRTAMQEVLAPSLTTSSLGTQWKIVDSSGEKFATLDGLSPIAMATRGKYLIFGNDPTLVAAVLSRMQQPVTAEPAIYIARFEHERERANYYRMTSLIDHASNSAGDNSEPRFFSQNAGSLSKVLGDVRSESVIRKRDGMVERQVAVYEWQR